MSFTGKLRRVITTRVYTLACLVIVALILGSVYLWTKSHEQDWYKFNRKFDRQVVLPKTWKNDGPRKWSTVTKNRKTILYWTRMFTSKNFYLGDGDIFEGCPVRLCMGTDDREYQSIEKFDAILFHGPELNADDSPKNRSARQRYIFVDMETPIFHPVPGDDTIFNHFFNWTLTYRRDADVMRPYGIFKNITSGQVIPPNIAAQWINVAGGGISESMRLSFREKNKIAAWFVSHCETNSKREEIAGRLQQYVMVDIYGDCGEFRCSRRNKSECYEKLESEYFFYLSFENSMCKDYLTEQVYKVLEYNVVPVVYGGADYQSFLPPNSYIDVRDFPSVVWLKGAYLTPSIKELAEFLIELSQDENRPYLEYFKWKSFYNQENKDTYIICELCKALHDTNLPNQVHGNIDEWWTGESECKPPPEIS